MSNFVSCDRNIENLNLLVDLVLAQGVLVPASGAAAASEVFRFGKGRLEKFPILFRLNPGHLFLSSHPGCCPAAVFQLWGCKWDH